jgi:hypothetical protein
MGNALWDTGEGEKSSEAMEQYHRSSAEPLLPGLTGHTGREKAACGLCSGGQILSNSFMRSQRPEAHRGARG